MIKLIYGDILEAKEDIIAHQVNCRGVFGAGLALQIKKKYPQVFYDYKDLTQDLSDEKRKNLLGYIQGVKVEDKMIFNMFGQNYYGRDKQYTDTDALLQCFNTVRKFAELNSLSVAMPYRVGCGLGGAKWSVVDNHLMDAFDGYSVTLYKLM